MELPKIAFCDFKRNITYNASFTMVSFFLYRLFRILILLLLTSKLLTCRLLVVKRLVLVLYSEQNCDNNDKALLALINYPCYTHFHTLTQIHRTRRK